MGKENQTTPLSHVHGKALVTYQPGEATRR